MKIFAEMATQRIKKKRKRRNNGGCLLTFQRFWCKAAHRGFWDSIGSLHNSSSTFDHLDSHGSLSRTHLCLGMSGGAERKKKVLIKQK